MNIAILHYHLNRGGVTRVIANQLLALDSQADIGQPQPAAVLFGGRDAGWPQELGGQLSSVKLSLHPLAALDYDEQRSAADAGSLAEQLQDALSRIGFLPRDTVLHVHNHSLGKNAALPGALRLLAEAGYRLLLQIHDFAEDFRPRNYARLCEAFGRDGVTGALYPQAANIHYGVLNRRDQRVLTDAGVPVDRLHFLPNPVPPPSGRCGAADVEQPGCANPRREAARRKLQARFGVEPHQRYVLYPVRGIRRKNVGEALLWSLLAGDETVTAITLAPLNPAEQREYNRWRSIADELKAPFLFETGEAGGLTFEENLAAADLLLTTSLAEGFGMVYLESWLAGRALTGRNLPEITADFIDDGLEFPYLYERLDVPIDWIGREQFAAALEAGLSGVMKSFALPPLELQELDDVADRKIDDGWVDFGDLDETLQQQIIHRAASDSAARREILERNPLARPGIGNPSELIDRNRRLVEKSYSLESSGCRLHNVYRSLLADEPTGGLTGLRDGKRILDSFLEPARYRLIRG